MSSYQILLLILKKSKDNSMIHRVREVKLKRALKIIKKEVNNK